MTLTFSVIRRHRGNYPPPNHIKKGMIRPLPLVAENAEIDARKKKREEKTTAKLHPFCL
jgi:hypothetical protein